MSFSVNTNNGAMTALQYLSQTQAQLDKTQTAINSGLKVASAKDDGAIYAIAQNQRGAVAGYASVVNSLNNGSSAIDVALSAGQSISDLLIQMKQKALSAADPSLDTASRQALNANFTALRDQISTIVKNAVFNGFNLVDGSTNQVAALASADGTRRITTAAQNLSACRAWHRDHHHHVHGFDHGQGLRLDRGDPDLAVQRQLGSCQAVVGRGEVLDPGGVHPEAVRHPDPGHRQSGRRQHGAGKRDAAVPTGQAAAWRSSSVDRQPGPPSHPVAVPLNGLRSRKIRAASPDAALFLWRTR